MWFHKKDQQQPYIKNVHKENSQRDFSLHVIGIGVLLMLLLVTAVFRYTTNIQFRGLDALALIAAPIVTTLVMTLFPRWQVAVKVLIIMSILIIIWYVNNPQIYILYAAFGALVAPSIQKMDEWERAIILRFGKFHQVKGPGVFILFPIADKIAETVDLRIRVTDFSAETTLTRDSVTVTVDALCFWLVWDAEKAICEVQNYEEAVVLSAKTALRNAISKHDLTTFLELGDEIEHQIRKEVDIKTTDWGITVQHIEITDIQIPQELQSSLSRLAQAEREKKGRILLAEAEIDIANRFKEAAEIYINNETALKLKNLSILNEGLKAGNSMMLVPNSITEELKVKDVFGLEALQELKQQKK
ncbi:SPFH domain-containing protein [Gracilinema caldarium]|uniref:Band 7 protein n=1 Tax=Gracilinema caldarium (strain ATCC 51460 / DSM 7334 / H1) TaxID=744872 RepID=F8F283_GRAC1|nr:SPFH domain-containing protein [Gracilinema caldarium]AEJ20355.1 band 7 protein [Gracilinema caldarium DSM 7334]